jgi:UDP-glucuronate 4-epimerase
MTRVLLTGAAGFIGFHTAKHLAQTGHEVVGLDNLSPYYDVGLKRARLSLLAQEDTFRFVEGDLHEAAFVQAQFDEIDPEIVIHLAAQTGVRHSLKAPRDYVDANVSGFLNVLEGARHHEVGHMVYASSSSVYGANREIPFAEDQRVEKPMSLYGATKRANELMAYSYAHLYGLPLTGLRLFTVYGPWGRPDMAYFLFTKAILAGEPISVFNRGACSRDFTYVDDVVGAISQLIELAPGGAPPCRILNVGRGEPAPLLKMIALLEENLGIEAKRVLLPMQPGDVEATHADISELRRLIGFEPKVSLQEGLSRFVAWYREFYPG